MSRGSRWWLGVSVWAIRSGSSYSCYKVQMLCATLTPYSQGALRVTHGHFWGKGRPTSQQQAKCLGPPWEQPPRGPRGPSLGGRPWGSPGIPTHPHQPTTVPASTLSPTTRQRTWGATCWEAGSSPFLKRKLTRAPGQGAGMQGQWMQGLLTTICSKNKWKHTHALSPV